MALGRYFMTDADHVRGHVSVQTGAGIAWSLADRWSLRMDVEGSFGSADLRADDATGTVRGTFAVVVGAGLRF
jgi:hypothetical protein